MRSSCLRKMQFNLTLLQQYFPAAMEGRVEKSNKNGIKISTSVLAAFMEQMSSTASETACCCFRFVQPLPVPECTWEGLMAQPHGHRGEEQAQHDLPPLAKEMLPSALNSGQSRQTWAERRGHRCFGQPSATACRITKQS